MTVLGCCSVVYLPITELQHPIKRYVRPTKDFKDLLSRTFFGRVSPRNYHSEHTMSQRC